jgi:hypothetical protein
MGGYVRYARRTTAAKPAKRNMQRLFHKKALVFTTALSPRRPNYVLHLDISHKRTLESMTAERRSPLRSTLGTPSNQLGCRPAGRAHSRLGPRARRCQTIGLPVAVAPLRGPEVAAGVGRGHLPGWFCKKVCQVLTIAGAAIPPARATSANRGAHREIPPSHREPRRG